MIAMLIFSGIAAVLVSIAGRGDRARDPRLTVLALGLLVVFPLLGLFPKLAVLPAAQGEVSGFPWLVAVWSGGFAFAAARLGLAVRRISQWRGQSRMIATEDGVEIRSLAGLRGPVAVGVIRPVIFVPEGWDKLPEKTRRIVLDHEMAHHRRKDPLWRWVAEIACAVSGCNPLVIWMSRRLAAQCEFACDALVIENGTPAADYARVLCDFAEARIPRGPVLAMAAASSLESRVRRLVAAPRKRQGSIGLFALIALTLACAGALALLGSRPAAVPQTELDLRWSANPFPGEN